MVIELFHCKNIVYVSKFILFWVQTNMEKSTCLKYLCVTVVFDHNEELNEKKNLHINTYRYTFKHTLYYIQSVIHINYCKYIVVNVT